LFSPKPGWPMLLSSGHTQTATHHSAIWPLI
jgi:hypothetical protein